MTAKLSNVFSSLSHDQRESGSDEVILSNSFYSFMIPDQTNSIRQGENLDLPKLDAFLTLAIDGFSGIKEVRQFPGGYSNLTYLISTETQSYVLRRPPFGANIKSGHDMSREFKVLSLLKTADYPHIPTPFCMENDGHVLDAPFYIMSQLDGVILRAKDAQNPLLSPSKMRVLSENLIDNLAAIHQLDTEKTGLQQLGKPEGYVKRQVEGWIKRYEAAKTDDIPAMENISQWMSAFTPRPQTAAFLHNDYKYDNVVFDKKLEQIIGVLDWEMSTVGDPLMDLGAALAWWCEPNDPDFTKMMNLSWLEGNLSRQEVADRYAQKTGRDLSDIYFYYIFGLYKNAVIAQQIYARWKQGLSRDARFASLIVGVKTLAEMGEKAIVAKSI